MTYIPPVRYRLIPAFGTRKEPEKNAYWQGYLNDEDTRELLAYDFTAEDIGAFWANLEDRTEPLLSALGREDCETLEEAGINVAAINDDRDMDDLSEEEWNALSPETRLLCAVKCALEDVLETERNELVVSMLEDMSDEEYERIKAAVDAGERHTRFTDQPDPA